jgi:hypothetical protein
LNSKNGFNLPYFVNHLQFCITSYLPVIQERISYVPYENYLHCFNVPFILSLLTIPDNIAPAGKGQHDFAAGYKIKDLGVGITG